MIKVRIAKKTFVDSFGNQVQAGDRFGIIEVRPLFVSGAALKGALDELTKAPKATDAAEGGD